MEFHPNADDAIWLIQEYDLEGVIILSFSKPNDKNPKGEVSTIAGGMDKKTSGDIKKLGKKFLEICMADREGIKRMKKNGVF